MSSKDQSTSQKAEEHASARHAAPTSVQPDSAPAEEDGSLAGAGKDEQHRLLKDNVEKGKAERHPDLPAGQHATGSFTGENEYKK